MNSGQAVSRMKIIVNGPSFAGKSCLCHRFSQGNFLEIQQTIGIDCARKNVVHAGRPLLMLFWDTTGAERHRTIQRLYYKDVDVVLLCIDLHDVDQLLQLSRFQKESSEYAAGQDVLLVGCKKDLPQLISDETIQGLMKENSQLKHFFKTSSKTGEGVAELENFILQHYSRTAFDRPIQLPRAPPPIRYCSIF